MMPTPKNPAVFHEIQPERILGGDFRQRQAAVKHKSDRSAQFKPTNII
jgi:hypothetical protein